MRWRSFKSGLLALTVVAACQSGHAAEQQALVALVETDDSLCLAHGGQLISVRLTEAALAEAEEPVEVWVDRWFMQVQTADHTKHVLTSEMPERELGCSQSLAGPQHWTLSLIKRLPVAGSTIQKD
ncbi:MAG: hypothetical protein ACTS9Y_10050 [Methylophilus sp.]|uniref:hypothetical protein n=1 Tax=Methylophilus sp. TaxID=29541 RepID=UPI003FA123C1